MDLPITLKVNGATHQLTIDTRTTLLDVLREHLGLTGPKKGCDRNILVRTLLDLAQEEKR